MFSDGHLQNGGMDKCCKLKEDDTFGKAEWDVTGLTVGKEAAYADYQEFSKQRREFHPEIKDQWAKKIRTVLGPNVKETRPTTGKERVRSFKFAPLSDCRQQFAIHLGAPDLEWDELQSEPEDEPDLDLEYERKYELDCDLADESASRGISLN